MQVTCPVCSETFDRKPSYLKKVKNPTCSLTCQGVMRSKNNRFNPKMDRKDDLAYRQYTWVVHKKYGLSEGDVRSMMDEQQGCCKICKGTLIAPTWGRQSMHIDHNHDTDKVRGLLCGHCNVFLGRCKDNIKTLKSAIKYLQETQ